MTDYGIIEKQSKILDIRGCVVDSGGATLSINTTCDNGTQLVSVGLIGTKLSYQSTLFITDMHVIIEYI